MAVENYINHDISNPRLTLGFGQSNGSGGTVGSDLTVGLQGNGNSIPNTGGISLAAIMLGYVTNYSYAQQGASNLPVDSNHSFYCPGRLADTSQPHPEPRRSLQQ